MKDRSILAAGGLLAPAFGSEAALLADRRDRVPLRRLALCDAGPGSFTLLLSQKLQPEQSQAKLPIIRDRGALLVSA